MAVDDDERGSVIGANGWNSRVEIRQLRAFVAVVERGSISAAAIALGYAQSTLSEALAALDRAIGVTTIARKRGGHATSLTAAGGALLPHARHLLQELDAAHRCVAVATGAAAPTADTS